MKAENPPIIRNSALTDEELYRARQLRLFERGRFGFVPVAMLAEDDQVYLDLGAGPLRVLDAASTTPGAAGAAILLGFRPDGRLDSRRWPAHEQQARTTRMFARRPSLDQSGRGGRAVVLELPATLRADGSVLDPAPRLRNRALVMALIERTRRKAAAPHHFI